MAEKEEAEIESQDGGSVAASYDYCFYLDFSITPRTGPTRQFIRSKDIQS